MISYVMLGFMPEAVEKSVIGNVLSMIHEEVVGVKLETMAFKKRRLAA